MKMKLTAKGMDQVFYYCLLGILIFTSITNFFMFIINWEAWFFGIKMEGLYAGLILFSYFLISSFLAYFLIRHPEKIVIIAGSSVVFFGFLFMDSSVTVQELSNGKNLFTSLSAARVIISINILAAHLIVVRFYKKEDNTLKGDIIWNSIKYEHETNFSLKTTGIKNLEKYATWNNLILAMATFIIIFFLVWLVIPMIIFLILLP
ncbi:hypothetical protein [Methanoplanus limicola]|uniref:Uncharacterized protein n=1 Tax=Methanoplanus limicola DSM 2279 TaxID=937775 RepID=H1YZZ2_9EURY|nr:hypothetical protein [Methanoplanus limicola]EHQ35199.1 hypothetical protein Metlim_1085 [Methanoplanus limicola DSM 2279]